MGPSSYSSSSTGTAASSSASNIPTALSAITSLLQLTRNTLNSISHLLPIPNNSSTSLVACPFDPNHLVPVTSLFSHYLSCLSSTSPLSADDLLRSLQYPYTLHSFATIPFTQPLENPNSAELCHDNDASCSPPLLKLQGFLYTECANFRCTSGLKDLAGFSVESIKLLPSQIWAIGEKMNDWDDYPALYSFKVLRAILRDHIGLLFRLGLKAVIREAASSLFIGEREEEEEESGGDERKFDCPVLTSVMRWLGFQLSVLYGELNGKFFAINIIKECVLDSAFNSAVFLKVEKITESSDLMGADNKLKEQTAKIEGDELEIAENHNAFKQINGHTKMKF